MVSTVLVISSKEIVDFFSFSESILFCKNSPLKLENGFIKRNRLSLYKAEGGWLGEVQFECHAGYEIIGEKWYRCVNGSWPTNFPKCVGMCVSRD